MANDPTPHLLFPTCADCKRIGLHVPPILSDMERAIGHEAAKAFLLARGGKQIGLRSALPDGTATDPLAQAEAWLRNEIGFGKITLPKGPASRAARTAWTIFRMLSEGHSLARIATATDCHMRTISVRKRQFTERGLLPMTPALTRPSQETPKC